VKPERLNPQWICTKVHRHGPPLALPTAGWVVQWPGNACAFPAQGRVRANIDSETEARIQTVIERVSHRLSTIREADEIWIMDQGVLVERGTHDGLIGQDGVYAKLVRLQFADGEAA
jgi:hypothetical protein